MRQNRLILILLAAIILLTVLLRLYRFDNPIADWHAWRQVDTSAVSRSFVENGFDLLHPRYHDLSNIPSGQDNPEGYRFVEFPIYNALQAGGYLLSGSFPLEQWGRLVSIFGSILAALFIYLILARYHSKNIGLFGAFLFAVLPFSIYYGRVVLPDQLMIACVLGAIYFFGKWIDENSKVNPDSIGVKTPSSAKASKGKHNYVYYSVSLLFAILSLLLKPYAVFFLLPMIVLAYQQWGVGMIKKPSLWVFLASSLAPLALWRIWMTQFPEGIPANRWLFNEGNIRFKGAYFYWLFGERIAKLILGYFGVVLVFFGLLKQKKDSNYLFFLSFLASSLLYLVVIARGNVQHDYYQILIVPSLVIFAARGIGFLLEYAKQNGYVVPLVIIITCIGLSVSLSWYFVRDYFNINNMAVVEAGQKADEVLPQDAKVIAPYGGDTTLLYYTGRVGWPSFQNSTEELMKKGATHVVLVSPSESDIRDYSSKYSVLASESAYLVVEL